MNSELSSRTIEIKYFYPVFTWAVLIFISSSLEGPSLPPLEVWSLDKLIHAGVYGILAFTSLRAFSHYGDVKNKNVSWIVGWSVAFCFAYGASDEIHQIFVRGRYASLLDFLADAIGIAAVHIHHRYRSFKTNQ